MAEWSGNTRAIGSMEHLALNDIHGPNMNSVFQLFSINLYSIRTIRLQLPAENNYKYWSNVGALLELRTQNSNIHLFEIITSI